MMEVNIFQELFLSTEIWSYFGPLAVIVAGLYFVKKERVTFVFFFLIESLIAYQYFTLISSNGWYIWHSFLMIFGILATLGTGLSNRKY